MIDQRVLILLLLSVGCFSTSVSALELPPPLKPQMKELEQHVRAVYATLKPVVVRISISPDADRTQTYSGIIVREDGLVLTHTMSGRNVRMGDRLVVRLPGGRQVRATALGWSNEWGFAFVKISEPGPWPRAELAKSSALGPGEPCVALGYPMAPGSQYDQVPALRLGCITKSAGSVWSVSSCLLHPGDFGSGLFDLKGRLLGVTTQILGGNEGAVHTAIEVVKGQWDDLVAGKNVDFVKCVGPNKVAGKSSAPTCTSVPANPGESTVGRVIDKVKRATVKLQLPGKNRPNTSGVIVTPDGHVITCAHGSCQFPGQKLVVSLTDGRIVGGIVLGTNWVGDIAVVKLTDKGPWPYVPMGDSTAMKPQVPCLLAGFPTKSGLAWLLSGSQPDVRNLKIADRPQNHFNESTWSCFLATAYQYEDQMMYGDSGGGVFDLQGNVVAVNQESQPRIGIHGRVELFKRQWDLLVAGKSFDVFKGEPLAQPAEGFRRTANRLPPFAVEVLGDGKGIALGSIVRSDGMILTKASELRGTIACKMPDGRVLSASTRKAERKYDLAVLKVEAINLPVAEWSKSEGPSVGALVSAIIPGKPPLVGVVSHTARPIPPQFGQLEVDLRDTVQGLETVEAAPVAIGLPFRKGDVILHIEGHPTPNREAYRKLLEPASGEPPALAGDRVRVGIKRGKDALEVQTVLVPRNLGTWGEVSYRCAGFPSVFDADIPLAPHLCGGPIIDGAGLIVGVAIACRPWSLILPASTIRKFLAE